MKQQAKEEECKAELKVRLQTMEKELSAQRKRNTELLSQVHMLDDAKMLAEKASREAVSRAREVEERLQLLSTLHKLDLGKLQFNEKARTEDDVDRLFPADMSSSSTAPHASRPPSGATSRTASRLVARPASASSKTRSLLPSRPSSASSWSTHARPASASTQGRPPSGMSRASDQDKAPQPSNDAPAAAAAAAAASACPPRPVQRQRPASASRVTTSSALAQQGEGDVLRDGVGAAPHGKSLRSGLLRPASAAARGASHEWSAAPARQDEEGCEQRHLYTLFSEGVGPVDGAGGAARELEERIGALQEQLDEESNARIGAQEHVLSLAEQLLDKEKAIRQLRTEMAMAKGTAGKLGGGKREERARAKSQSLEAQNMALLKKLRELERAIQELENSVRERDALAKTHKGKIAKLLMRIEVLEEEKARLSVRLRDAGAVYSPGGAAPTESPDGLPTEAAPREQCVLSPSATLAERRRVWNKLGLEGLRRTSARPSGMPHTGGGPGGCVGGSDRRAGVPGAVEVTARGHGQGEAQRGATAQQVGERGEQVADMCVPAAHAVVSRHESPAVGALRSASRPPGRAGSADDTCGHAVPLCDFLEDMETTLDGSVALDVSSHGGDLQVEAAEGGALREVLGTEMARSEQEAQEASAAEGPLAHSLSPRSVEADLQESQSGASIIVRGQGSEREVGATEQRESVELGKLAASEMISEAERFASLLHLSRNVSPEVEVEETEGSTSLSIQGR